MKLQVMGRWYTCTRTGEQCYTLSDRDEKIHVRSGLDGDGSWRCDRKYFLAFHVDGSGNLALGMPARQSAAS